MRRLLTILLLQVVTIGALAHETVLTVSDLDSAKIVGEMGVPLHTVHKVECKVVDMSFTKAKADEGRIALQIISVDGKAREGKHYIDIPSTLGDPKPRVGTTYRFWAYETVDASGYPTEAFEKIGELPFATVGLHFRSKLVVLKNLQ